jgi:hypothetical protein
LFCPCSDPRVSKEMRVAAKGKGHCEVEGTDKVEEK